MEKLDLVKVQECVAEFDGSVDKINAKLKSLQSQKSRLKKQKAREDYNEKMSALLGEEQLLKEARQYLEPKAIAVTEMTESDIEKLTYDETVRAIKSIQSKKCLIQFDPDATTEYERTLQIEEMLKAHREVTKEHSDNLIKKSKVNDLINHIEQQEQEIDKDYILKLLQDLIK